jgi:hypothetical protein
VDRVNTEGSDYTNCDGATPFVDRATLLARVPRGFIGPGCASPPTISLAPDAPQGLVWNNQAASHLQERRTAARRRWRRSLHGWRLPDQSVALVPARRPCVAVRDAACRLVETFTPVIATLPKSPLLPFFLVVRYYPVRYTLCALLQMHTKCGAGETTRRSRRCWFCPDNATRVS